MFSIDFMFEQQFFVFILSDNCQTRANAININEFIRNIEVFYVKTKPTKVSKLNISKLF